MSENFGSVACSEHCGISGTINELQQVSIFGCMSVDVVELFQVKKAIMLLFTSYLVWSWAFLFPSPTYLWIEVFFFWSSWTQVNSSEFELQIVILWWLSTLSVSMTYIILLLDFINPKAPGKDLSQTGRRKGRVPLTIRNALKGHCHRGHRNQLDGRYPDCGERWDFGWPLRCFRCGDWQRQSWKRSEAIWSL